MTSEQRRAVFLDRDGTLIEEKHYLADPEQVTLLPGAAAAIRAINQAGWLAIVASNQSGVGRGYFETDALLAVERRLVGILSDQGARIDAFLYCPHAPEDNCTCRKPKPGLLIEASRSHGAVLAGSWIVGDKESDVESGRRAGCKTCLVLTGYGNEQVAKDARPDLVAPDLFSAVRHILAIKGESTE